MQVIPIKEPINYAKIPNEDVVLAMGFFDGVHQGHQAVIKEAKKQAKKNHLKLAVMTFDRYPKIFFQKLDEKKVQYVTTIEQRLELFKSLGVDLAYVACFDQKLALQSPQEFVDKFMVGLHAKIVVAGFDYTYGKKTIANMQTLPQFANGRFKVISVPQQSHHEEKIGTTKIKKLLQEGNVDLANHLLGYPFEFAGKVVHGHARGRILGFPTLNIESAPEQLIPGIGIYAVKVKVEDQWYLGMASISHNETFGANPLTVEINLFNFSQMVYGQIVKIKWFHYLRAPVKFRGADQLVEQLKQDKKATLNYFEQKDSTEVQK